MFAIFLSVLVGCGPMAIEGNVVDATGTAIEGARVTAIGTPCSTLSDAQGAFDLECQPGNLKLIITKEGYESMEAEMEAPERKRYKSGKHLLIKTPDSQGLFLFSGDAYVPLKQGNLTRTLKDIGVSRERAYCLNESKSEVNEVGAGLVALFDNNTEGWRPFKLDENGCAYRDARNAEGRWVVQYREKAEYEERTLSQGKKLARLQLKPGQYFVADWKGFFVQSSEDKKAYTGFWIRVK